MVSATLGSFTHYYPNMASHRRPPVRCRRVAASGCPCARMTTNRPPDCGVHGPLGEPPATERLLNDMLFGRSAVIDADSPDWDRPPDDFAMWETAKLAQARVDDQRVGLCRCREWLPNDTVETGPTGPLHPDGAIGGGCAVHDERHATPGGAFLAVAADAGYEESPMIAEAARRFATDIEDGTDIWDSWHPDNHTLRR